MEKRVVGVPVLHRTDTRKDKSKWLKREILGPLETVGPTQRVKMMTVVP